MNRETCTAREVANLITADMGEEVNGLASVFDALMLPAEALEVFEGKTIRWMNDDEHDPFDFSDPWVEELKTGCYVISPVEGLAYAWIIASVDSRSGRCYCGWKGKLVDSSEV